MPRVCDDNKCSEYIRMFEKLGGKALIIHESDSDSPKMIICFGKGLKSIILRKYGNMYLVRSYDRMPKKYVCLIRTVYSIGEGF